MRKIHLVFTVLLVFLLSALTSYSLLSKFRINIFEEFTQRTNQNSLKDKVQDGLLSYNILLLGYGGAGHEGGTLSDVMMIASINPGAKKVRLISVPRDLWVAIPIRSDFSQNFKINHAYAIGLDDRLYPLKEPQYKGEGGAATLAKKVVGEVVGLPIHYYISVDFDNFKKIIDTLGGVEVEVPVTFDDYFYPIKGRENDTCGKSASEIAKLHEQYSDTALHHQFECRYEHIHFDKGVNHMDGETALKFVRSRASAQHGGDFARSLRQMAVLLGVKDKLISLSAVKKADELFEQFRGFVKTDIDINLVRDLAKSLENPGDYEASFVSLSEENVLVSTKSLDGQFILIPKEGEGVWAKVHSFIQEQNSPF